MNYIFSKLWIAINVKQFSPVYNILVLIKELAVEPTSGRSIQWVTTLVDWIDFESQDYSIKTDPTPNNYSISCV